jgi:hypothetical protein
MVFVALAIGACLTLIAASMHGETITRIEDGDRSPKTSFMDRVLAQLNGAKPRHMDSSKVPGMELARTRARGSACARRLSGLQPAEYLYERLLNTTYFAYDDVVAAELAIDEGREVFRTLYAYSNPESAYVLLTQADLSPDQAKTAMPDGNEKLVDTLPAFEKSHGFRRISIVILQALMLLHERAHIEKTIAPDYPCLDQSMRNTQLIAKACFPEIIDPLFGQFETAGPAAGCKQ